MRKEVENWWAQAQDDLKSAEACLTTERYYLAVFMCQQAAEKALKAFVLYTKNNPAAPEMTSHSLIFMGKSVNVPNEFQRILRELTPQYTLTRYPDVSGARPSELYDKEKAKEFLDKTKEFLKWIQKQLKQ